MSYSCQNLHNFIRNSGITIFLSDRLLVLEPNSDAQELRINKQAITDYLAGLTPFQTEPPFDGRVGCLIEGRPIFYVAENGEVIFFGHSPNFRIPALLSGRGRAASPLDFVPEYLRSKTEIDVAEAIFGYIGYTPCEEREESRAGRVFFTDAHFESDSDGIWLSPKPITPKILGSPKPTTFQHYLVQDCNKDHDPDNKKELAHYATPTPDETVIRGHKLYWHKKDPVEQRDISESDSVGWSSDTQHTQIKPVKAGVTFRFRIYFENLRDFELGALLWVLTLPGEAGKEYCHKIGMGKPLGMGAVKISPMLYLSDRRGRYTQLFADNTWHRAENREQNIQRFIGEFEQYVLDRMDGTERGNFKALKDIERIQRLLKMLEWPGPDRQLTEYMKIEPVNEYRERPVLPDPLNVEQLKSALVATSAKPAHKGKAKDKRR
jgi:CRISPR-associated protein (TIGR03986 family)